MTRLPTGTVEELVEALIDYRGKTPPKSASGVRLITAKVVKGGRIRSDRAEFIAEETYGAWMRRGFPREWMAFRISHVGCGVSAPDRFSAMTERT